MCSDQKGNEKMKEKVEEKTLKDITTQINANTPPL